MLARLRNRREDGLGLALPSGQVSVVQRQGGAARPVGEGAMADHAEGETVGMALDGAPGVHALSVAQAAGAGRHRVRLTATNAHRWPVRFEGRLVPGDGAQVEGASARLGRKDGMPLRATVVPARGRWC